MKVLKWLDKNFELSLMAVGMVAMTIILALQVIMRKFVGHSLAWPEEACRYIFMWSAFLSISLTLRNGTAMKTDIIVELLPKSISKVLLLLIQILLLGLLGWMTYVSYGVIGKVNQMCIALPMSMKWIYLSELVGFFLGSVRTIQNIVDMIRNWKKGDEKNAG